jgi:branched-chain amino acid aminotransferase
MTNKAGKFEFFNGSIFAAGTPVFSSGNRGLLYGDGVFETIRVSNGRPSFIEAHWNRLNHALEILQIPLPAELSSGYLNDKIQELVKLNEVESARIRFICYREASGFYTPQTTGSSWHMTVSGIVETNYNPNPDGIAVDVFEEDCKTRGRLSNLKTLNALIYVIAGINAKNRNLGDVLIKNDSGNIIESSNSNLFLRRGSSFTTPPLSEGCLDGVMRKQVIRILKSQNFKVEENPVKLSDVEEADELLLTNVIRGTCPIKTFRQKEYKNKFSGQINQWLEKESK